MVLIADANLQHPSLNVWMALYVCVSHVGVDYVVFFGMYRCVQCVYGCMHSSVNVGLCAQLGIHACMSIGVCPAGL